MGKTQKKRNYSNVKVRFKHIELEAVKQMVGTLQYWQLANFSSANIMNSKEVLRSSGS
jgi:hypothetical protein